MAANEIPVPRFHVRDFSLQSEAKHANPFLVDVRGTFTHESGRRIANIPGFFDGEGRWTVRFSPPIEGSWKGRTVSTDPELHDVELHLHCTPNDNPEVRGLLGIDRNHPRRFAFEGRDRFIPLGFEFDWMFAVHQADPDLFRQHIATLKKHGFNYLVTNVYAHSHRADSDTEWVYVPPRLFPFGGTNEAPDHTRLNIEFFQDFDRMIAHLHEQGMVVHLMFQVQNKQVNWPARRSVEDELFWRYLVARYQAYGNIVWDPGKETYKLKRQFPDWDYVLDRIALIRECDAYSHLLTVHDSMEQSEVKSSPADEAADFVSDQIHLADTDRYNREAIQRFRSLSKPYMNIEYGYEEGAENLPAYRAATTRPWQDILLWTYAIYLGGAYPCYYYSNTSWDLVKFHPEPPGWPRYRYLVDLLGQLELNAMAPGNEFVERGYCLAEPARQYLVLLPEGGDAVLDLTAVPESAQLDCQWMDIHSGERRAGEATQSAFLTAIANPLPDPSQPCALLVRARS